MSAVASTSASAKDGRPAGLVLDRPKKARGIPVAWTPNETMEYPEWVAAGRHLGALGRRSPWLLADWIRFGNAKFGERYARATRITGYDVQTLMNMVYVAARFEISRRREVLSWSHHEAVAPLESDEQDRWLDRAVADRLSVADLRLELRNARAATRRRTIALSQGGPAEPAVAGVIVCPSCGHEIATATAGRRGAERSASLTP